jgi:hypothetical protein
VVGAGGAVSDAGLVAGRIRRRRPVTGSQSSIYAGTVIACVEEWLSEGDASSRRREVIGSKRATLAAAALAQGGKKRKVGKIGADGIGAPRTRRSLVPIPRRP